jgi:hypothetical protein
MASALAASALIANPVHVIELSQKPSHRGSQTPLRSHSITLR